MKLLGLEAVQNATYYQSRYQQIEDFGADLFVLNGLGDPGFWPAGRYRVAGSKHIDDIVAAARDWHAAEHFDGVLSFSESAVIAVAAVAEALGLPGIGTETARTSRNKLLMRQAHERADVPRPRFRLAPDLAAALETAAEFGYPVIIKPTLGAASNFVFRVDDPGQMRLRFPQVVAGMQQMSWFLMEPDGVDHGPHGVLVESFLDGPEFLTEALAWDDEVYLGSIVDRVTVEGATFDDDVHHGPTSLDPEQVAAVHQVIAAAARAQGIRRSVMHAEVRYHQGRPHMLEIAVRPGGGGLDYFARISAGYSPIQVMMDVACGQPPGVSHYHPTNVHTAGLCLISAPGRVEQITVPAAVSESGRVFFLKITAKPGDVIKRPPHGNNILGFLCTTGTSLQDAMQVAGELAGQIDVRMSALVSTERQLSMQPASTAAQAADGGQPARGGTAAWACHVGFPPSTIFPFTPPERVGIRNLLEFQALMYRPLYWLGRNGQPGVDYDLSLAGPPEWSQDGRSVTVTLKPWKWSNGETICADNVMFWVNMMVVKASRLGTYSPGYFPDNLTSYQKIAPDQVRFTFDKVYSRSWVLMNQLTLIIPMPRAWDRTAAGPADASTGTADVPAVYDYLVAQHGSWAQESNEDRARWPSNPIWSVVDGPWRLKSFELDGTVTFQPNEHYCGPNKPYLDEFRQVPSASDEDEYQTLLAGPGTIQVGYLPHGMGADHAADPLAEHFRLVPQDIYLINYMPLNFENPGTAGRIIGQAYFRQALQCAMDQDTAIREIFHGYGYRTTGPVPRVPDNQYVSPAQRRDLTAFDIERARTLLAGNGWDVSRSPAVCVRPGPGPGCAGEGIQAGDKLSFTVRYVAGRQALARLMSQFQADAAKAGIELHLQEVFGSVLVAEDHGESSQDRPHTWELQCWNGGWVFYGKPTGEVLFKTRGGSNFGRYSDERADQLIERTVVSDDASAMDEYQDYLAEQVPVVWTPGFPLRVLAVAKNLRGVEPVNPYGMINPENWYYVDE